MMSSNIMYFLTLFGGVEACVVAQSDPRLSQLKSTSQRLPKNNTKDLPIFYSFQNFSQHIVSVLTFIEFNFCYARL